MLRMLRYAVRMTINISDDTDWCDCLFPYLGILLLNLRTIEQ